MNPAATGATAVSLVLKAAAESQHRLARSHTVLLLGWAGASPRQLTKYGELYTEKGLDTLGFNAPFRPFAYGLQDCRDTSHLAPLLSSTLFEQRRRLILHVMSMQGLYTLISLLHSRPFSALFRHTDLVVFDSCPVYVDHLKIGPPHKRVLDSVSLPWLKAAPLWQRMLFYPLWRQLEILKISQEGLKTFLALNFGGKTLPEVDGFHFLREHPDLPHNLLFLYSDGDSLCQPKTIKEFHDYVEIERGIPVAHQRFSDSQHVRHLLKYPREYAEAVDRCLELIDNRKVEEAAEEMCVAENEKEPLLKVATM